MAPLIPIVLQLAQAAPAIMRYFGVGESNAQVAEKVVDLAQTITGQSTPEEAVAAVKASAEFAQKLQEQIIANAAEFDKLVLADLADARSRDVEIRKLGKYNIRADVLTFGAFVIIALITWKVWTSPDVPEWVRAAVILVLGRFLGYMDQIFQFEFGATRKKQ